MDRLTVCQRKHDIFQTFRALKFVADTDVEILFSNPDIARRDREIGGSDYLCDRIHIQVVLCQFFRNQFHAGVALLTAGNRNLADRA